MNTTSVFSTLVAAALGLLPQPVHAASPSPEPRMTTYVMGFLYRGPAWSREETPERAAIQEAHMANINRLAAEGKLVLAGPFADDGDLRGLFLYNVKTLDEAQALATSDPAVKAGRLRIELHPWWGPGYLPRVIAAAEAELAARDKALAALPEGFKSLAPDLAVGKAPDAAQLRALHHAGYRTVVDLRMGNEPGVAEEKKLADELGLAYVSIPLTPDTLDKAKFEAFRKLVDDPAQRPLVVHCATSNRVGMLFAVKAAVDDQKPLDAAEAAGVAAGLKSEAAKLAFRKLAAELVP